MFIVLQSQDLNRVNLDQHLQSKLLQLPPEVDVILSNYRVTQAYFHQYTVPKLSTATVDMFVNILSNVEFRNYNERTLLTALIPRLTQANIEKLASGKSYKFIGHLWRQTLVSTQHLQNNDQLRLIQTRSIIRWNDIYNTDIQEAIRNLPPDEIRDHVQKRPEIIKFLVGYDCFDPTLFELVSTTDNRAALLCVISRCEDTELVARVISEKRQLFNTIDVGVSKNRYEYVEPSKANEIISHWLAEHLNDLELSMTFKPLLKETTHDTPDQA